MRPYEQNKPNKQNCDQLGIPEGLVALRRDQISVLRNGYTDSATSCTQTTVSNQANNGPKAGRVDPSCKSASLIEIGLGENLSGQPNGTLAKPLGFFQQSEEKTLKPGLDQSTSQINVLALLKSAIHKSLVNYKQFILDPTKGREPLGWFSRARHGNTGAEKALGLNFNCYRAISKEDIFNVLDAFFSAPDTRYNNNSFSCFALDQINVLFKLTKLTSYNVDSWDKVKKQIFDGTQIERADSTSPKRPQ